jgi:hypothetical protein
MPPDRPPGGCQRSQSRQTLNGEASRAGAIATIVQGSARTAETILPLPLRLGEQPSPQVNLIGPH